ncbi:hypothetical protein RAZWK3B_00965 [Roseobacter sp. AzwK-3b]|uniref:glycosyltransferase family 25 protein n=1 Tax=Roseobacter sp. AzwK-3b TaxID=351016 RepID=UPI00015697E4|nr:glycosyltransferase family 25 protein [Roseobacter sp. AzwK-3b]EDM72747.1 hypothetical protein RAZWK3B_00965 [Roseobacter sp. AzwK-3b]
MNEARSIDIYKITSDALSEVETEFGLHRIQPIEGAKLDANSYFGKILDNYRDTGELLSPSELGCTLSHISVYQRVVEANRCAIILEADISPHGMHLEDAIAFCSGTDLDFVHLGWHPQISYNVYFVGRFDTRKQAFRIEPSRNFYGAFAYYVSPTVAFELLDFHQATLRKADYWSEFFETSKTKPYFRPFFEHPLERGELDRQRKSAFVKTKRMPPKRLKRILKSRLRTFFCRTFSGYRPIKPGEAQPPVR